MKTFTANRTPSRSRLASVQLTVASGRLRAVDQVGGGDLAMMRRAAEHHLRGLRAAIVQMRVVLPGEPDAAVHLDALGGDVEVRLRAVGLREARDQGQL